MQLGDHAVIALPCFMGLRISPTAIRQPPHTFQLARLHRPTADWHLRTFSPLPLSPRDRRPRASPLHAAAAACIEVGLALRANLVAPVGVWLQRVHAMVPDPVRTGASPVGIALWAAGIAKCCGLQPRILPGSRSPFSGDAKVGTQSRPYPMQSQQSHAAMKEMVVSGWRIGNGSASR